MTHRLRRTAAALACALTLAGAAGCAVKPETIRTYTPAHGVNATQGDLKVRNLVVATDGSGSGTLYGTLVSGADDQLTGITGAALAQNGTETGKLAASGVTTTQLPAGRAATLGAEKPTTLTGDGLRPGLTARVTLSFAKAGQVTLDAPVMDAAHPDYATAAPQG